MSFMSNRIWQLTNPVLLHAQPCLMNCHTCHTSSRFSFPYTYGIKVRISALFPAYFRLFRKRRKSAKPHDDTCKSCYFDPISGLFQPFWGPETPFSTTWFIRITMASSSFEILHSPSISRMAFSFYWGILKSDGCILPKTFFSFLSQNRLLIASIVGRLFGKFRIDCRISPFQLPVIVGR